MGKNTSYKSYKRSKRDYGCLIYIFQMIFLFVAFFIWMSLPEKPARWSISIVLFVVILYCDKSGLKDWIVKRLPKDFPFRKKFAKKKKGGDVITERYKTIVCFCLLYSLNTPFLRKVVLTFAVLMSMVTIWRYLKYIDKVTFGMIDEDSFSPVTATLLISGFCFLLWSIDNCEFNTYFWILWIGLSLAIIIAFFIVTTEYKKKKSVAVAFVFCIIFWMFGMLCTINWTLDFGEKEEYRVRVLERERVDGSKGDSYYLTVTPWSGQIEKYRFSVSYYDYEKTEEGEWATVHQSTGSLGMTYYELEVQDD